MLYWRSDEGALTRAFTRRDGGSSEGPFAGLNLGDHVGDDPAAVSANRAAVVAELGAPVVYMAQVHGADVVQVGRDDLGRPPRTADAMVTIDADLGLGVLVADCTPVLLHDISAGVVGVAHAGRPGMVAGVVPALVEAMRDLGAHELRATVGPSVCARCYEVPEAMRADAAEVVPTSAARTWSGTPAIDVAGGVVEQLAGAGVDVEWVPGCTREDERLYSFRRDGTTGRLAGLVVRRSR